MNDVGMQMSPAVLVIEIILIVISLVASWMIFQKGGEPGWKCLIPIYNLYIEFKLFWGKGWFFLLLLIPLVNIVVAIMLLWKMCKSFGKGGGFFVLMLLLPFVAELILAFGSAQYIGPNGGQA